MKKFLVFFLTGMLSVTPCVPAYAAGYEETPDLAEAEAGSVTEGELSVSDTAGTDTVNQVPAEDSAGGKKEGAVSGGGNTASMEGSDAAASGNTESTAAGKNAAADGFSGSGEGEKGEELFAGPWPMDPEDGGIYYIRSAGDVNAVWDIEGASLANRGNLQLFGINYTEAQQFTVKTLENGNLVFFNHNSGKVLDVEGGANGDGTNISQFEWNGTDTQQWQALKNEDGSYVLWNAGRQDLVLDCSGGKFTDGTNLALHSYNGTAAQSFVFQRAQVKNLSRSVVLRPANGSKMAVSAAEDSLLAIDNYSEDNAIHFELTLYWGGYYTLRNQMNGLVIEASDPNAAQGSDIILGEMDGSDAQLWKPVRNQDGSYTFFSKLRSDMVMKTADDSPSAGTGMILDVSDGLNNERFKISTIEITPTLFPGMIFSLSSLLDTDYVLNVSEGSSADGANIDLLPADYTAAQTITLESVEGAEGQFFRLRTGAQKYIAISGSTAEPGVNIIQNSKEDVPGQYWYPDINADGSYTFRSALDQNYVLSTADYADGSGKNIELYPFDGSAGQQWHLASMHITYCKITEDGSNLIIRAEGHTPSSDNGQVYLFAVDPYSQNTAGYEPVSSGQLGDRIALSIPYGADDASGLSGKKFYLAVLDGGIYHVVSNGCTAGR